MPITCCGGYSPDKENHILIDDPSELGSIRPCIEGSQAIDQVNEKLYNRVAGKKWEEYGSGVIYDAQ